MVIDFDHSLRSYLESKAADFGHLIDLPTFMLGVPLTEDAMLDELPQQLAQRASKSSAKSSQSAAQPSS